MALYVWAAVILALVGGIIWLYVAGRSAGKAAIAADVAEETADILRKQDKAATEAASEDVVSRLRKGGF
jgi:ribulose-5-phosphate 4-epimerase/fuculose-1-phosphate aldolase